MQITLNRERFLSLLKTLSPAIKKNSPKVALQNYRLFSKDGGLHLHATDTEFFITARVCDFTGDVDVLIPNRMVSILSEMGLDEITLKVNKDSIVVSSSASKVKLQIIDVSEFPLEQKEEKFVESTVDSQALVNAINKTHWTTSDASRHFAFSGVLVEMSDGTVELVSTDTSRLSYVNLKSSGSESALGVVPPYALSAVARSLSSENATIRIGESSCVVEGDDIKVGCRLINAKFLEYKGVIPDVKDYAVQLTVTKNSILSATRLAISICNVEKLGVTFSVKAGFLLISSTGAEVGNADLSIPVVYDGDPVEVIMRGDFVEEWLRHVKSESFEMYINDSVSSVVFIDGENTYIVQPIA